MDYLKKSGQKKNNLFQSGEWGSVQEADGRTVWRVKNNGIEALIVKNPFIGKKFYLYSPRGPVFSQAVTPQDMKDFLRKVTALAGKENAVFYRIEPAQLKENLIFKYGFKKVTYFSPLSRQTSPEHTLVLDLKKTTDTILKEMKPKWRYNIRLAERKGVKVRKATKHGDLVIFYDLLKELESRGHYHGFERDYYEKMFSTLIDGGKADLFIAETEGEALTAIFVIYQGEVATYLHGASSNNKRDWMPTYAAQWAAITEAKKRGCLIYDFWGIAPDDNPSHPWAGVTRFKKGFGGETVAFPGTFDLPLNPVYYNSLKAINFLRKKLR